MKILQDSTKKSSSPIQIPCTINIQYKSKISFFYLDKIILVSRLMITALDSATKSLANLNKNHNDEPWISSYFTITPTGGIKISLKSCTA